jgi:glycosyltransferase involved in cell wall biosynthesis
MSFAYVAYSSLDLKSANSVQTFLTCRALLGQDPTVRILLPRSLRRRPQRRGLAVEFVPKLPLRWLLGRRGEEIERGWFAAVAVARLGRGALYTRDARVARAAVSRGLRVALELHAAEERLGDLLPELSCLVVLNEVLAERMREEARVRRVEVIEDAFDETLFRPRPRDVARSRLGLGPESFVVGYSGLTFEGRGVDSLVEAVGRLPASRRAVLLVLGGRPQERARLRDRGAGRILDLGARPLEEVPEVLAAADVLAIPEVVNPEAASPLKMFEYAALELPIVAVDRPTLRRYLQDEAGWFRPGDVAGLVRALEEVAEDPASARDRARRARERLARFTYSERARRIRHLMEDIARG